TKDYILFGTDLFSEDHKDFVPFRNGDFFTEDYAMVKGIYYDNHTGEEIEPTEELEALKDKVEHELQLSDKVLQGDLLRFYTPTDDWEPIDTDDYFYDFNQFTVPDDLKEKWLGIDEDEDTLDGMNSGTENDLTENKNSNEKQV